MIAGRNLTEKQSSAFVRASKWEQVDPGNRLVALAPGPNFKHARNPIWRKILTAEAEGKRVVVVYPDGTIARPQTALV